MDVLERLLSDLYACLDSDGIDGSGSGADSKSIVNSIEMVVQSDTLNNSFDQELVMDMLFRSETAPPSLFKFLNGCVRSKDKTIAQTKIMIMKFIGAYVKSVGSTGSGMTIGTVAAVVFATSYDLYMREESRELKAACLLPIKKLLAIAVHVQTGAAARVAGATATTGSGGVLFVIPVEIGTLADLYARLLVDVVTAKQSRGGRCEILKVLGLLVRLYPDATASIANVDRIQDICDRLLKASFTGRGEPDFPAIAGCFSCLDRSIYNFESRYESPTGGATLWGYLLQAISSVRAEDTHRYAIVGKALRLVRNHGQLFRGVIAGNIEQTYAQIEVSDRARFRLVLPVSIPSLSLFVP